MSKLTVVSVMAALVAMTTLPAAATAGVPSIAWRPCPQDNSAECGSLDLPVNGTDQGRTFPMAVARRKATDPAKRIGVLLVNPGGPGASGVGLALKAKKFPAEIQQRFDIVGFDPRGIGGSQAITCSNEAINQPHPQDLPRDQREFDQLVAYNRQLVADCRRHSGPLFDHVDTLSVVRDMDALRGALGEQKINFLGVSYGTLIGQQYAQLHGDRIRSMVLDSTMDHSLSIKDFLVTAAGAVEDSLEEFAKWCQETPTCALHGPDALRRWDDLLAAADRGTLYDGDADASTDFLVGRLYSALIFPKWNELATWLAGLQIRPDSAESRSSAAAPDPGSQEKPALPIFCEDWQAGIRTYAELAAVTSAERAAAPHARFSPEAREAVLGCIGWPQQVNNPQRPWRVGPSAPTILMVNNRHDPSTGYAWALGAHSQAPAKTSLFTHEGWGHGVYLIRGDCVNDAVGQYLIRRTLPGVSCPVAPV